MTRILRKTDKGVDEIATRANRLVPRLRTALILVDGTRNEAELGTLIKQNARETIEELLTLGYVEVASVVEAPAKKAADEPTAKKAVDEPTAKKASSEAASGEKGFAAFRNEAVRAFNDLTGPAGEVLAMKMEKATSRDELAPLLQMAFQIIGNSRGNQAATEFKARFASF
jgi:ribosomal protein L12E/L44/L45/RPP1/RPP2